MKFFKETPQNLFRLFTLSRVSPSRGFYRLNDLRSQQLRRLRIVSDERGLTLVEIIVVLVILAILMNFLFSNLIGSGEAAKAKINDIKMQKVKNAISQYQLQYNQLPQDLGSLTNCAGVTGQSCVPVLSDQDSIVDIWGTPYQYRVDGGRSFTLRTLGADRRDGGTGADGDVILKGP